MAIPRNIERQDILDAIQYIEKNGIPHQHQRKNYDLVDDFGKKYPPKYVIAVADHLANGTDISTEGFNAGEARKFLEGLDFVIETIQEKYELVITADTVKSTEARFSLENLGLGDGCKPLDVYFMNDEG